jgi:cob(I)alamin adenosyltransferase
MKADRPFTGLGDAGITGLIGEGRFAKSNFIFEVLGSIDELSSVIGTAKASITDEIIKQQLSDIQVTLYKIMTELSYTDQSKLKNPLINSDHVLLLEDKIIQISSSIAIPADFILPGDSLQAGFLDIARTITRKVERRIVELDGLLSIQNKLIMQYINRLSTYFFMLEIQILHDQGIDNPTMAK